jgi:hypothetical protein
MRFNEGEQKFITPSDTDPSGEIIRQAREELSKLRDDEIEKLKRVNQAKEDNEGVSPDEGERVNPNLLLIEPELIGHEESLLWHSFSTATRVDELEQVVEKLKEYKDRLRETFEGERALNPDFDVLADPRNNFAGYLSNKLMAKIVEVSEGRY